MEISAPGLENLFVLTTAAAAFLKVEDGRTGRLGGSVLWVLPSCTCAREEMHVVY